MASSQVNSKPGRSRAEVEVPTDLEFVGGLLLLVVKPESLVALARFLTQHELSQDPHDLIATSVLRAMENLTLSATIFGAIYLLSHGIVKVVLVYAVLKHRLWAYPWMIGFLLAFIVYQAYRVALSLSWGLIALTVFDILVVWLTWMEYRKRANRRR
jgi:uncharacterized membrane protein